MRFVRTNELQLGIRPVHHRAVDGALRAHQRITTPYVSSGTKTEWVRSTRTNELQPVDTNDFDVLRHGTPRAHQRITTA